MISLRDVVTGFGAREPLAEVWRRSLRGGGGGAAEITGVPPLRYIGNGSPLTDYRIAGNTVQDGTPSPDAPVDVAGCGVRTGNLFDTEGETNGQYYLEDGTIASSPNYFRTDYIPVVGGETYTISAVSNQMSSAYHCFYDGEKQFVSSIRCQQIEVRLKMPSTASFARFSYRKQSNPNIMLNPGSTALPYEPYGYKLPPTVNGTEYPIYLGEVETTRRVKKLVLTGAEDTWKQSGAASNTFYVNVLDYLRQRVDITVCSHYISQANINGAAEMQNGKVAFYANVGQTGNYFYVRDDNFATLSDLKSYLAAQYAAGTPVTVWYVLANPETAVVNEPLMKIGDYADTISFAQAGVTIPTVNGENILTVPTTVPPSEITIKGGISSV